VNAVVLKRNYFSRLQLKVFDSLVWLWRRIDRLLPWPGISLIAVLRRPITAAESTPTPISSAGQAQRKAA
jgi:hypothetical protein